MDDKAKKELKQNEEIGNILQALRRYADKANGKNYEPTPYERQVFGAIVMIVKNMEKWY